MRLPERKRERENYSKSSILSSLQLYSFTQKNIHRSSRSFYSFEFECLFVHVLAFRVEYDLSYCCAGILPCWRYLHIKHMFQLIHRESTRRMASIAFACRIIPNSCTLLVVKWTPNDSDYLFVGKKNGQTI